MIRVIEWDGLSECLGEVYSGLLFLQLVRLYGVEDFNLGVACV